MLMVMIYSLGSVSGAHLNPAVTLGVLLSGRNKINPFNAAIYMCVQILGGVCAALLYLSLFGTAFMLRPAYLYSTADMCGAEILYTFALVYVVLNVATAKGNDMNWRVGSNGRWELVDPMHKVVPNHYFGLAIGFTVVTGAITIGAISGCSLNPAVSIGSMVAAHYVHGVPAFHFSSFYIFAPFVGAICGVLAFYLVRRRPEYEEGTNEAPKPPPPAPEPKTRAMDIRPPPQQEPRIRKSLSRKLSSNEIVAIGDFGKGLESAELFC